jgi:hypothetical protein
MTRNSDPPPPDIIDQIHKVILEYGWISTNSIPEQPGISRERIGAVIHDDLDMRKLSSKWDPKYLNVDQISHRRQSSEHHLEFFRCNPNEFLSSVIGDQGRNLVISL